MAGRQAKIISDALATRALTEARRSRFPERDVVIVLLSIRAGLRACEIAGLTWDMVLDARGQLLPAIELQDAVAKRSSGRRIPIHPELRVALRRLSSKGGSGGPVVQSARGGAMRPNSIVNWFVILYATIGAKGCSSHSGRRTFITQAARRSHKAGATLRDVQILAGHRSIETTQRYIDGDTDAQRRLVRGL